MKVYLRGSIASFVYRLLGGAAGDHLKSPVTNLSGVWKLNVEKSDFGEGRAPRSIDVAVEHCEPRIRYSGTFVDPEGTSVLFDFEAMLDGRTLSSHGVTILSKRIDANTTRSEWRSEDGRRIETTVMRVSPAESVLTVERHLDGLGGAFSCTEVYEQHAAPSTESISGEMPLWNVWRPERSEFIKPGRRCSPALCKLRQAKEDVN